jgi:hypothetical protein
VLKGVDITADKTTTWNIPMKSSVETLPDVVISTQRMVEADKTSTGQHSLKVRSAIFRQARGNNYAV